MEQVFVVIPTFNERENLESLLAKLDLVQSRIALNYKLTALFVDDNSPDQTAALIKQNIGQHQFNIQIIEREGKLGLGTAYIAGFKAALSNQADYIIQMDADLSHDPLVIPKMLENLKTHDLVVGSRYISGAKLPKWSILRKAISAGGNLYSRIILGWSIHDYTGGFNAYKRQVLASMNLDKIKSNGYSFQIEMKYTAKKQGIKIKEIPIEFYDRTHGKSKFSKSIFWEALFNTLKLRF